jgi:hypothetical protein
MEDWQFLVLLMLLLWILWRTRVTAQTSPWLRDALLRRMFNQLNHIEAAVRHVDVSEVEEETENWWSNEAAWNRGRPRTERRRCGPWCHRDWRTPGIFPSIGNDRRKE